MVGVEVGGRRSVDAATVDSGRGAGLRAGTDLLGVHGDARENQGYYSDYDCGFHLGLRFFNAPEWGNRLPVLGHLACQTGLRRVGLRVSSNFSWD